MNPQHGLLGPSDPAPVRHLRQTELATRWGVSQRTLERWRYRNTGPTFLKISNCVLYRLADIEAYELTHIRPSPGCHPLQDGEDGPTAAIVATRSVPT